MTYCKGITSLLFWELSECLTSPIKNHSINLLEILWLICMEKINLFLKKYSKFVISGNLGMLGKTHIWNDSINLKKLWCLSAGKNINFILHIFLEILQNYCRLVILGTLGMPGYAQETSVFICMLKINFNIHYFLQVLHFKEFWIWLANSILAHNSRTRILPDMGLVVKYQ